MPRSLRLPPTLEADIKKLAEEHDRSENGEVIHALKLYVQSQQKCSMCDQLAEIECKIGKCAPGTQFCAFHYGEAHLQDE